MNYLKEFRISQKMSHEELATSAGLDVDTVIKWEKQGIAGHELAEDIYYYCSALNCPVSVVLHFSQLQKGKINEPIKQN